MNRRSTQTKGFVKFPINNLPNQMEGGTFVRLVVIPDDKDLPVCCGGFCNILKDEVLLGDDSEDAFDVEKFIKIGDEKFPLVHRYDQRHFPEKETSVNYLAAILLGSTGWNNSDWICTYQDLTDMGKLLYADIQKLYPHSKLYLQTWLDT